MLDCQPELTENLSSLGYDVAVGYTGYFENFPIPDIPPQLHEKDLLIVGFARDSRLALVGALAAVLSLAR